MSADVAIVIPCFNDGATVGEALRSALAQNPGEIVVVDDGSDDPSTLEVLARIAGDGVRVVRQPNRGLSAARMAGVRDTTAPLIYPLDADDLIAPGSLEKLARALHDNPRAALAWGDKQLFGDMVIFAPRASSFDPWLLTYVNQLPVSSLVRRSELLAAGGWVLKGGYEDWDLWMTLAQKGRTGVYVPGPSQVYRIAQGRMLSDSRTRHADLYGQCRARHPDLFAARRRNRRRSTASRWLKLVLPVIDHLPGPSGPLKHRVSLFLADPVYGTRAKIERRRGRRRG